MLTNHLFFSFLYLRVRSFSFLASLSPSIYGAAFERRFTSSCFCAIIRQCRITLSLYKCTPLRFLVCLIVITFSALNILSTCIGQVITYCTSSQFLFPAREQQLPCCEPHIFTFPYKEDCYFTKDNQVTRSEIILCIKNCKSLFGKHLHLGNIYIWETFTFWKHLHLGNIYIWETFTFGKRFKHTSRNLPF